MFRFIDHDCCRWDQWAVAVSTPNQEEIVAGVIWWYQPRLFPLANSFPNKKRKKRKKGIHGFADTKERNNNVHVNQLSSYFARLFYITDSKSDSKSVSH